MERARSTSDEELIERADDATKVLRAGGHPIPNMLVNSNPHPSMSISGIMETSPKPNMNFRTSSTGAWSTSQQNSSHASHVLDASAHIQTPSIDDSSASGIKYNLYVNLVAASYGGSLTDRLTASEGTIQTRSPNEYDKIELYALEKVKKSHKAAGLSEEILFRYGLCRLFDSADNVITWNSLRSRKDFQIILKSWKKWTAISSDINIDIYRNYAAFRTKFDSIESILKAKRQELFSLRKSTMREDCYYTSKSDLMRIISDDTVSQVISLFGASQKIEPDKQKALVQKAMENRTLLAICISIGFELKFFQHLLEYGWGDKSLPLGEANRCHSDCAAEFDDLLRKQGSFMVPSFQLGSHVDLDKKVVVPIQYLHRAATNSVAEEYFNRDTAKVEKDMAKIGSGAFSDVYRVRRGRGKGREGARRESWL